MYTQISIDGGLYLVNWNSKTPKLFSRKGKKKIKNKSHLSDTLWIFDQFYSSCFSPVNASVPCMCLCVCTRHRKTTCWEKTKEILGLVLTADFSHSIWLHHLHFCVKILNTHNSASTFCSYLPPVLIVFTVNAPGDGETLCICGVAGGLLMLNTCRCHLAPAGGLVHPGTAGYALILPSVCWAAAVIWPESPFGLCHFLH